MDHSEVSLILHTDLNSSFVEVTAEIVESLSLINQLSPNSYVSPDVQRYYLEGEVDAPKLIDALSANKMTFSFNEIEYNDDNPIFGYIPLGRLQ